MTAHNRLRDLWNALEDRGATVLRVPLASITARTAKRLCAVEERRLRILADADTPGPRPARSDLHHQVEDVAALIHLAITEAEGAA